MKESDQIAAAEQHRHRISWRLTFSFSGEVIRLATLHAVEMISPASVRPLPRAGEHCGTWLELRDEKDRILFVRRLHNPLQTLAEHHSPDGKIEVSTRPAGKGEFEAIVPALEEAYSAVLMSSPLRDGRSTEPAKEVGRFPLREKRDEDPSGRSGAPSPGPEPTGPPRAPRPNRSGSSS